MTLVVSRRVVLAAGAGVVAAGGAALVVGDRLDDALRVLGVPPKDRPDAGDVRLAARARAEADALVDRAVADDAPAAVVAVLREQAAGLPATATSTTVADDLETACRAASAARRDDALEAVSPDLVAVLASLSAGLAQVTRTVASR